MDQREGVPITLASKSRMAKEVILAEGPYQGGRGRGRGRESVIRCYKCNQLGHKSFEFLGKEEIGQRGAYVAQNEKQQE